MKKRRITSLKDVKTLEVSLVERGANLKRRFPVMKARGDQMDEVLVEVLKAEGSSEAVDKLESILKMEHMPADAKAAIMAAMKLLEAYSDMMPVGEALNALGRASGAKGMHEDKKEKAEHEDKKEKGGHEEDEKEKAMEDVEKPYHKEKKEDDDLKKSLETLPPAARQAIDAIWKAKEELTQKSEKLEKQLGEEIAKRARREYLAKAEQTLCNIPGHSLDEVVDLMIAVKATDSGLGERVEKALEASSAALQGGALLVEAGRSVPDMSGGDPWAKIQRIAKSEVEKSGGSLSMPQAIAKTIQTNPALYQAYNQERQNGGR